MCPSMAERENNTYTPKPKKLTSEESRNHENPSKYFNQFLYKAIIVAIFLVIVPLLPSQTPEFFNQNLQYSRSWELLQLIFVGIAVSYGLFSKRNEENDKENNNFSSSKYDNAQSYVAKLLQVSSVFDDETEQQTSVSDDNKIQTWNSQYHREEPVVMVAKKSPVLEKQNATATRIDEKPLLLPVRSLKSRVSEPSEREIIRETSTVKNTSIRSSSSSSSSSSGSKRLTSSNSGKSRNGEFPGLTSPLNVDESPEANVVLRSPIPWRSRSGRMEMKEDEDGLTSYSLPPSMEESPRSFKSQSFRSSVSPVSKRLSPSHSFSSESQTKSVEDASRKKFYIQSSPPPAPPPPPPSFYRKSQLGKSNSSLMEETQKRELKRAVQSVPNDFIEPELEGLPRRANSGPELIGKSVRKIRSGEPPVREVVPKFRRMTSTELQTAEKEDYMEKVLVETDESSEAEENEDDYFEESVGSSGNDEVPGNVENVDKKADEFIAKFREQIRLQRIESIRKSTEQTSKKQSR